MIKAKEATNLQPAIFEWDEKFKLQVRDVPENIRQKLTKANEEIVFNKKHQKKTETNWLAYSRAFLRVAIAGWTGMTYRYLIDICKPLNLDPGVKLDDAIEFDQENLDFVIEHHRNEFSYFMLQAVAELDNIYGEQKKKELENLSNASGGN